MKRKYKLIKGSGGGANENTIGIEHVVGDKESLVFVSKVMSKTIELFGRGASLDPIGTTYGVHIRFKELKVNRKVAKLLVELVETGSKEIEEELKRIYKENTKKKLW